MRLNILLALTLLISNVTHSQTAMDVSIQDTRSVNLLPYDYTWASGRALKVRFDFKERPVIGVPGSGYYSTLFTLPQWPDNSGDKIHQMNFNNGGIYYRQAWPTGNWEPWRRFIIEDDNGNVGVGTTTPTERLSVIGNISIGSNAADNIQGWNRVVDLYASGHSKLLVRSSTVKTGIFSHDTWGGTVGRIGTESSHDLRLMAGYGNDVMTLNTSGNVGIGTTNPTEKLSVNGNVRAKKLIVTQNGWPDYVFSTAYKLRPIEEVANYIQTNKHLPDMPSAKDVEEKGLDIGKTQAALLKKIEELMLYTIELNKTNLYLLKKLSAMESKLQNLKQ